MSIKVSIITCCWNSEPFIGQCLNSLSAQTYPEIEFVFVDGGSTDGTLERVKTFAGDVKWVTNVRAGISNAMNVGVGLATGDVIAHLHADDYYLDGNVVAKAIGQMVAMKARWAFGRIVSDIDGKLVSDSWAMPEYSKKRLLKGNFIGHPSLFIERSLFHEAGGFDTSLKYAMDYDLWLRAAAVAEPVYLGFNVAAFRRHAGSTSTANEFKAFVEDHEVRRRHLGINPFVRSYHEAIYAWRKVRRYARS